MGSIAQEGSEGQQHHFSSPPSTHSFSALLFDMDGTIIDSTAAIEKHWRQVGREIGVPGEEILHTSHGRRSIDVLALYAPERANWEYVCRVEGLIPKMYGKSDENDDGGAKEIPGSRRLLDALEGVGAPWAIVTSGTRPLVRGWLDVMGLAKPRFMVTAEEVGKGKPDPECYRKGAGLLGKDEVVEGEEILVLEDAPAGVRSGKAAGFKVVALATTHDVERLQEAGADWIVRDMRSVRFVGYEGQVQIEIRDALVV